MNSRLSIAVLSVGLCMAATSAAPSAAIADAPAGCATRVAAGRESAHEPVQPVAALREGGQAVAGERGGGVTPSALDYVVLASLADAPGMLGISTYRSIPEPPAESATAHSNR